MSQDETTSNSEKIKPVTQSIVKLICLTEGTVETCQWGLSEGIYGLGYCYVYKLSRRKGKAGFRVKLERPNIHDPYYTVYDKKYRLI